MDLVTFLDSNDPVIEVVLSSFTGSSPREEGASLFVSSKALHGTIGGGQLEYLAIDEARRMLRQALDAKNMTIPLGPDIGQCCGGVVTLSFRLMDAKARQQALVMEELLREGRSDVYIFGAGHVGRALAASLHLLPVRTKLIDSRKEELALTTVAIDQICTPLPEAEIRSAKPGSAFVILTHDHALDFLLAQEALARSDAAYVGMIGSKTKRGTFRNWLRRENPRLSADALTCPIGAGGSIDKRPEIIAAMVAAELMTAFDKAKPTKAGLTKSSSIELN